MAASGQQYYALGALFWWGGTTVGRGGGRDSSSEVCKPSPSPAHPATAAAKGSTHEASRYATWLVAVHPFGMNRKQQTAAPPGEISSGQGGHPAEERADTPTEQKMSQNGFTPPFAPRTSRWLTRALWVGLTLVILLLFILAAILLTKSHVLSTKNLTSNQTKSLWAFLGVALGAVVTLISALLTEQHNRRTDALTWETAQREHTARKQQQALAHDAERRLKIDTVAKVLELVTVDGGYAPRARVNGAIATLMELDSSAVGVRVLGALWDANAVDCETAVWLIGCILQDSESPTDQTMQAANLLRMQAPRLVPAADDPNQNWYQWPWTFDDSRDGSWLSNLPYQAKNDLLAAALLMLRTREIAWWKSAGSRNQVPILVLVKALDDQKIGPIAAQMLESLLQFGALDALRYPLDDQVAKQIKELSSSRPRSSFLNDFMTPFGPWAKGKRNKRSLIRSIREYGIRILN
jgi:hypothetical protein